MSNSMFEPGQPTFAVPETFMKSAFKKIGFEGLKVSYFSFRYTSGEGCLGVLCGLDRIGEELGMSVVDAERGVQEAVALGVLRCYDIGSQKLLIPFYVGMSDIIGQYDRGEISLAELEQLATAVDEVKRQRHQEGYYGPSL